MKKNRKIERVEYILNKYKKKNDSYLDELRSTYDEYLNLSSNDKVTNNLYVKHMEDLCNIEEDLHSGGITIALMLMILIITSFITFRFYVKYAEVKDNLDKSIVKANAETNMKVTYINLDSFSIFQTKDENYLSQRPTTINIKSTSSNYNGELVYRLFMVPKNDKLKKEDIIDKSNLKYTIDLPGGNIGIKELKNAKIKNDKILLFEGTMNSNDEIDINFYMWLNADKTIDANKKFDFTFFIDGYVK